MFETNQLGQAAAWIMSFGGGARALNPPELIEDIKRSAKAILAGCKDTGKKNYL